MKIIITIDVGDIPEGAGPVIVADVESEVPGLLRQVQTGRYRSVEITYE